MDGEIGPDALEDCLEDEEDLLVVDIRQPEAFREGHIPGSLNVPFSSIPDEIDRVAGAEHVVTVCPHGQASVKAARLVASYRDFDGRVESLAGGLDAWEGPLERDGEATPDDTEHPDAPF